jgi:lipoate-protein ligase A
MDEVSQAFKKGFAEGFDIELTPYHLSETQIKQVEQIADERYNNDAWTFLR